MFWVLHPEVLVLFIDLFMQDAEEDPAYRRHSVSHGTSITTSKGDNETDQMIKNNIIRKKRDIYQISNSFYIIFQMSIHTFHDIFYKLNRKKTRLLRVHWTHNCSYIGYVIYNEVQPRWCVTPTVGHLRLS